MAADYGWIRLQRAITVIAASVFMLVATSRVARPECDFVPQMRCAGDTVARRSAAVGLQTPFIWKVADPPEESGLSREDVEASLREAISRWKLRCKTLRWFRDHVSTDPSLDVRRRETGTVRVAWRDSHTAGTTNRVRQAYARIAHFEPDCPVGTRSSGEFSGGLLRIDTVPRRNRTDGTLENFVWGPSTSNHSMVLGFSDMLTLEVGHALGLADVANPMYRSSTVMYFDLADEERRAHPQPCDCRRVQEIHSQH